MRQVLDDMKGELSLEAYSLSIHNMFLWMHKNMLWVPIRITLIMKLQILMPIYMFYGRQEQVFIGRYSKVPKFWDARKLCSNLPKIQTKRPNLRVFRHKDADGIANSEDPDQTAPLGAV